MSEVAVRSRWSTVATTGILLASLLAAPSPATALPPVGPPPRGVPAAPVPAARQAVRDTAERCAVSEEAFRTSVALVERWADRRRRLADVPGLVLGVTCGPGRSWIGGFGAADPDRGVPATDTALFRIASITKVFTALAVVRLRDEGRFALDDPVADHLPWFAPENAGARPAVTVRHLLTHTSGLPTNSAATDFNRMTAPTDGELRAGLSSQRLVFAPGSDFKYSNLGFAVLGQLVEVASGETYDRFLERQLLAPLRLRRTVAHPTPDAVQAVGHHLRVAGRPRRPADFLHLAAYTPAGGMATTARDMVRFAAYLLAPEREPDVLDPATVREMQRVHHPIDGARGGPGLAWAVERQPGSHVVYHGGGLPTQSSHLRLDLENGFGVVVLTNAEDGEPEIYAREVLALLGRHLEDGAPDDHGLRMYVGRYRFEERERWIVRLPAGLALVNPKAERPSGSIVRLTPLGDHRFRVESGGARGEVAEFVVDEASGQVLRLQMPALMYRRIGPVVPSPGG